MTQLILLAAMLVPALLVLGGLLVWRLVRSFDKRRSPLTVQLLNLPGEGLRKRIAKHDDKFNEASAMLVATGPILLASWLLVRLKKAGIDWSTFKLGTGDFFFVVVMALILGWTLWKLIHHARRRRLAIDGLHAELSVAQCLTPLIAEGAMVFHDFPTDRGNIDHIVIARNAVFAIETKSRRKPAENGKASARVQYDGQQLSFPRHTEVKPIEQAAYQAKWLENFLHGAGVKEVRVIPVLALPGWYVEQTNRNIRPPVLVSNCTNTRFMLHENFGPPLQDSQRQHIAHVLTKHYPKPDELGS